MPMIMFVLNVLWFMTGGVIAGLAWVLAGVIMAITIIGLPWARSCFMLARFSFWPFGYDIVSRDQLTAAKILAQVRLAPSAMSSGSCLQAGGWRSCTFLRRSPMPSPSSAFPLPGSM